MSTAHLPPAPVTRTRAPPALPPPPLTHEGAVEPGGVDENGGEEGSPRSQPHTPYRMEARRVATTLFSGVVTLSSASIVPITGLGRAYKKYEKGEGNKEEEEDEDKEKQYKFHPKNANLA